MGDSEDEARRSTRRDMLRGYYGTTEDLKHKDIYDINEAYFQHEKYLDKLFKDKSLHELMDKESEIIKQIRSLDSEMQTLVYENYNKFISATDTIKKMKNDFRKMEDEMNKLDNTLMSVTQFSDKVNTALHEKRSHISQLSGVHTLLHKLQFLFELPNRLKKCMELKQYALAVRYYMKARDVLNKYKHMSSFQGIHSDCEAIVLQLMQCLRKQLRSPESTTRELTECVDLLLKLDEPAGALCEEFLSLARDKVDESLEKLRTQVELNIEGENIGMNENMEERKATDILEFMDCGCNGFLGDISLVIASYNELFMSTQSNSTRELDKIKEVAKEKIASFIMDHMAEYFKFVRKRLEHETQIEDNTMLVRALDKFYRKVQSVHQLMPESGMDRTASNIVAFSAHNRVAQYTNYLQDQLYVTITDTRQALVASRTSHHDDGRAISQILQQTSDNIQEKIKSVLNNLKAFTNHDIAFSVKPYFRGPFCIDDVREGLVVNFLKHLMQKCKDFAAESNQDNSVPASLLLILCRLTFDFSSNTCGYLLSVTEEHFAVEEEIKQGCLVTTLHSLQNMFKDVSQELLNRYVNSQGLSISQMLRKSVETRDWLNTIEPRTVRAVMKRVVEDITTMDVQVGSFFEEGVRKANSSDSSKWTHTYSQSRGHTAPSQRNQYAYGNTSNIDTSLMNNIQKLFSERIEVFTSVDFNKVSVLTGIVKIALKTLVECVRLRTFSKYGLQQVQVDTHYMQLFLWRFVNDENVVRLLLDEAVNSAIHRCVEPQLMEPSVVEMICEKT